MSDIKDVDAVRIIKKVKVKIIMQCAGIYHAKVSDSNLNVLKSFKKNILILLRDFQIIQLIILVQCGSGIGL